MIRRFLTWLSRRFPERVIPTREGGDPYLSRFYLFGGPRNFKGAFDAAGEPTVDVEWKELPFNLYLHKFHRGDDDQALHRHPWRWAVSLILAGGYSEERRVLADRSLLPPHCYAVERREVRPWTLNFIRGDDFHRVDLLEEDCWSLFLAGPRASSWSFWDRATGEETPWREYLARKEAT